VRRDRNHRASWCTARATRSRYAECGTRQGILRGWWRCSTQRRDAAGDAGAVPSNVSHDYDNGLADLLDVVGRITGERNSGGARAEAGAQDSGHGDDAGSARVAGAARQRAYAGQFLWRASTTWGIARLAHRQRFLRPARSDRGDQPMGMSGRVGGARRRCAHHAARCGARSGAHRPRVRSLSPHGADAV